MCYCCFFFFQAEDGIRYFCLSRGLGDCIRDRVIHLEHILKCAKDVLTNIYTYDKDLEDAEWIAWFCDMEDEEE